MPWALTACTQRLSDSLLTDWLTYVHAGWTDVASKLAGGQVLSVCATVCVCLSVPSLFCMFVTGTIRYDTVSYPGKRLCMHERLDISSSAAPLSFGSAAGSWCITSALISILEGGTFLFPDSLYLYSKVRNKGKPLKHLKSEIWYISGIHTRHKFDYSCDWIINFFFLTIRAEIVTILYQKIAKTILLVNERDTFRQHIAKF